jgi:glycosyltransferase involved in cell wall biosynthesis
MKKVQLDTSRIHFVGTLPYAQLLTLFQVSAAHLYFTYPFVLSWSMLEAMSCGTPLIASRTAPVMEVIRDNENGLLADFFSPEEVAQQVIRVLEKPALAKLLRSNARASVVRHFNLADALPLHIALIEDLARGMKNPAAASRIAKHYPLTAHQKMIQEMG